MKVKIEAVCMVPCMFVKLETSYIICHLFNYWIQCNGGTELWWFINKKLLKYHCERDCCILCCSKGIGEFSFILHMYLCIILLLRYLASLYIFQSLFHISHKIFRLYLIFTVRFYGLCLMLIYILVCRVFLVGHVCLLVL